MSLSSSSSQFNKGPSYGLSAEVKNRLAQKYDPQKEAELQIWIENITGREIGPDFQKGLKDGVILCEKINRSALNWHQAKTKGIDSGVDIGVKYSEKQERCFDDAKLKAGQCVIGLQVRTPTQWEIAGAALGGHRNQSGMTAYGTRRHLYDPKNQILPPMDHSTISLQMGTNKCASQVGMTAPGTRRHIYDSKLGTDKCDDSSMSLQMGYNQGANQSGQVFGLGRQIYDPKYCPQGHPVEAANTTQDEDGHSGHYYYYQEEADQ
ncbi:hypothetical protein JD844_033973 [Phrynosoma platyrhinos]|uniref:Calponin n=1 Tax=Phrynosoma platyrhinos TaxID=52577 RepID=A0ABQ7T831_PHRPL|nr:hypothetical protein JD844_033973 [Phrynosoma platyrhinos]